uniref:Reverse transcriptase domain-containing protein n=1 Tax=Tanacetum cinerariifolium TaxID=118510 RepID=A0A699HQA8_TANCI|nr:reverse transcriptase domain-containing protein [Tanacetum cinerariifolium]
MTKLTQKNVKFNWGEEEETAFQLIKQNLCSAPILALPKGSENFIAYCDASHKGLGERKTRKGQNRSKLDKNEKRGEAEKSLKQSQWVEEEKLNKTQKEWPKMQIQESITTGAKTAYCPKM